MKKLVLATLLGLATASNLLSPHAVKADEVINRNYVDGSLTSNNYWAADHPRAYADGYRQGEQSAREGKTYQPRTTGGEFARGFLVRKSSM